MDTAPSLPSQPATDVAALFARERIPMLRMATLMVGSPSLAEEIVGDSFAIVAERWNSLERPGGYLRTTVVNGCAQALRRRETEDRLRHLAVDRLECDLPTRLIELRDALEHLSDRQRMVVVLRYFVDISDAEIADLLDVRPSTVRSLARRAFAVLRKELS